MGNFSVPATWFIYFSACFRSFLLFHVVDRWSKVIIQTESPVLFCSLAVLNPRVGHTMDVLSPSYLYPLSLWLTLLQRVLSTTWYCLSRPCVVFLTFVHLALFLALFLSPGNSLVSSWCDHSMLASSLWQCLTVPSLLQLCWEFLCCPRNTQNLSQLFHLKGLKTCFFILPECPAFTAVRDYRPH